MCGRQKGAQRETQRNSRARSVGATDWWSTAFSHTLLVYNRVVQEVPADEDGECRGGAQEPQGPP